MIQSPLTNNALRRRSAGASAEGGVIYGGYLRDISCKGQEIGARSAFHDNVRGRPFFRRRRNDAVTAQRERDKTAFGGACQRKAVLFTAGIFAIYLVKNRK